MYFRGMQQRVIFHVDMDAFFASVEIARDPSLKGKPVIVGGDPNSRGVVSTCSYEARVFGVHSAMSLSEAQRRCPQAIFLEGSYSLYSEYSEKIMNIFRRLTEKVQVVSVDEAYLDVTEKVDKHGGPLALAELLRSVVFKKTQLTCSIGVASNKLVAKMASTAAKPNGAKEIKPGEEAAFLAPLKIGSIPGIGAKTEEAFHRRGILLIEDIQLMDLDTLLQQYGQWGYQLRMSAFGQDNRPVEWGDRIPLSLGAETTFERDQTDCKVLHEALEQLVEKACRHLHENKMRTRAICLKLRDNNFKTITRSCGLFSDTNDINTIQHECREFFNSVYFGTFPLRLLGVSLHKLTDTYWQPTLWDWESRK